MVARLGSAGPHRVQRFCGGRALAERGLPNRESASAPKLMESGKPYLFIIDLWATSNVFLPGHRIRLEISSSNFPRFDRNLNTGEPFGEGTKGVPARQTVFHQDDLASYILLPVIPK